MTNAVKGSTAMAGRDEPVDGPRRLAGRGAQLLLGIPLGLFQVAAAIGFTLAGETVTAGDWLVAVWGVVMGTTCAVVAFRIYRSVRARRLAFVLLAAQALFSLVKLIIYRESTSLVFLAIIVLAATALALYHRAQIEIRREIPSGAKSPSVISRRP